MASLFGFKLPRLGLWFWRRLLSWFLVVVPHATLGWVVYSNPGAPWLGNVCLALIIEALLVFSIYFGGTTLQSLMDGASKIAGGIKVGWGGLSTLPNLPATTTTTTAAGATTTVTAPANAATVDPAPRVPDE